MSSSLRTDSTGRQLAALNREAGRDKFARIVKTANVETVRRVRHLNVEPKRVTHRRGIGQGDVADDGISTSIDHKISDVCRRRSIGN